MGPRQTDLRLLAEDVTRNLARFDDSTGRFLTGGGWAVTSQDIVSPLALLSKTQAPDNPYDGARSNTPTGRSSSQVDGLRLPFNPCAADDAAPVDEAAGILTVPLEDERVTITLEVAGA